MTSRHDVLHHSDVRDGASVHYPFSPPNLYPVPFFSKRTLSKSCFLRIYIIISIWIYFSEVELGFYQQIFPYWTKAILVYFLPSENYMSNESLVTLEEQSDFIIRWVVGHLQLLHGEVLWWRIRPHIPLPAELGGCCLGSAEAGYRNRWLFQARVSPAASYFLLLRVVLVQHVPPDSKKSTFKEHGEHTSYDITYQATKL